MKWVRKCWSYFLLGLSLAPVLVFGNTDTHIDLKLDEAKETFKGFLFDITLEKSTATLRVKIPNDCKEHFKFATYEAKDKTNQTNQKTTLSFRIRDTKANEGKACLDQKRTESFLCDASTCTVLKHEIKNLNAKVPKELKIGVTYKNTNVNTDKTTVHFGHANSLVYINPIELEQRSYDGYVSDLKNQVSTCQNNLKTYPAAREALTELRDIHEINEEEYDKELEKLSDKELDELIKKAKKVKVSDLDEFLDELEEWAERNPKSKDKATKVALHLFNELVRKSPIKDLDNIQSELKDWAEDREDSSDSDDDSDDDDDYDDEDKQDEVVGEIARIYFNIAKKYTSDKKKTAKSYENAQKALEEALKLDGLSDAAASRLEEHIAHLGVSQTAFVCQNGIANNPLCRSYYQKNAWNFYQYTNKVCSSAIRNHGEAELLQQCNLAKRKLTNLKMIPQSAFQIDQQRQKMQQEILRELNFQPGAPMGSGAPSSSTYHGNAHINMLSNQPRGGQNVLTGLQGWHN